MFRPAEEKRRREANVSKEEGGMDKARLDKVIAGEGTYSRREVKLLVRQGRVLVDGVPARSPEDKVDPEAVEITVDGTVLHCRRYTWIMLHKPAGVPPPRRTAGGPRCWICWRRSSGGGGCFR